MTEIRSDSWSAFTAAIAEATAAGQLVTIQTEPDEQSQYVATVHEARTNALPPAGN